jgi:hypothetical protein
MPFTDEVGWRQRLFDSPSSRTPGGIPRKHSLLGSISSIPEAGIQIETPGIVPEPNALECLGTSNRPMCAHTVGSKQEGVVKL